MTAIMPGRWHIPLPHDAARVRRSPGGDTRPGYRLATRPGIVMVAR